MANITKKEGTGIAPATQKLQEFIDRKKRVEALKLSNSLQIAFLFDTTGSMFKYYETGKAAIYEIARQVAAKVKQALFCYLAYKNHGDEESFFDGLHPFYATKFLASATQIETALAKVRNGGGGDGLTALEDVLYYLANEVKWETQANKAVVLIGDMPPHGVLDSVAKCPKEINYRSEVALMKQKGIKIYAVYCHDEDDLEHLSKRKNQVKEFYQWIAEETGGKYLELAKINDLVDIMVGVCMKETGHFADFIANLKQKNKLVGSTQKIIAALEDKR